MVDRVKTRGPGKIKAKGQRLSKQSKKSKMASNTHDINSLMQGLDSKSRNLIGKIVAHLKSQGNFDELRKDCLEELDKMVYLSTVFSFGKEIYAILVIKFCLQFCYFL